MQPQQQQKKGGVLMLWRHSQVLAPALSRGVWKQSGRLLVFTVQQADVVVVCRHCTAQQRSVVIDLHLEVKGQDKICFSNKHSFSLELWDMCQLHSHHVTGGLTHCGGHHWVTAVSSEGFTRENRGGDGNTDLQDEQNQEQTEKSKHRHLRHTQ